MSNLGFNEEVERKMGLKTVSGRLVADFTCGEVIRDRLPVATSSIQSLRTLVSESTLVRVEAFLTSLIQGIAVST